MTAKGYIAAVGIAGLLYTGCGNGEDADVCVDVDTACSPLYTPEFDEIYSRTFEPTCGIEGRSCHSTEGAQAGLILDDPQEAYDRLLGEADGRQRVIPGDPGCSLLIRRVTSDDPDFVMPPGSPLSPAEQCVLVQWVAEGAEP